MASCRLILPAVLALFALPPLAGWLAVRHWQPDRLTNYGQLIGPAEFQPAGLRSVNGGSFDLGSLHGRWVLIQVADGVWGAPCRTGLFLVRQARLAQGPDMDRVDRLLLAKQVLQAGDRELHQAIAADASLPLAAGLYLMDPLGRIMMRYPQSPDSAGLIRDLRRLLKASSIG